MLDAVIRIILATVLGGLIGIEREISEHSAGFRTHILVSVGAAAFTLASTHGLEGTGEANRISAQIVSGIGFLGAGAIIRHGATVKGLTTAASLWAVAAVGLLSGQGSYFAAVVTTLMVIVSLYGLGIVEGKLLYRRASVSVKVSVHFRSGGYQPLVELLAALAANKVEVGTIRAGDEGSQADTVHLALRLPRRYNSAQLAALITQLDGVKGLDLN